MPAVKTENTEVTKTVTTQVENVDKTIDLSKPAIKDAITKGKAFIKEGKTKVDAAMLIFESLKNEDKEVIIAAIVDGASLTEKGAVTYFYNCRRKSKKL